MNQTRPRLLLLPHHLPQLPLAPFHVLAKAANISLPEPSFQPHTLQFDLRKKEKEERKLLETEEPKMGSPQTGFHEQLPEVADPVSDQSSSSQTSGSGTQTTNKSKTRSSRAALAALEAEKKKEALLHKSNMAAIKKATIERIKKQKEEAAKRKK